MTEPEGPSLEKPRLLALPFGVVGPGGTGSTPSHPYGTCGRTKPDSRNPHGPQKPHRNRGLNETFDSMKEDRILSLRFFTVGTHIRWSVSTYSSGLWPGD